MSTQYIDVNVLKGMTLSKMTVGTESIDFETTEGRSFHMFHQQGCCESVVLEDVTGDVKDLIGSPLVMAEEVNNEEFAATEEAKVNYESVTWTFYKFATQNGYVTLRWCGTSNGYYSERVDFCETTKSTICS